MFFLLPVTMTIMMVIVVIIITRCVLPRMSKSNKDCAILFRPVEDPHPTDEAETYSEVCVDWGDFHSEVFVTVAAHVSAGE